MTEISVPGGAAIPVVQVEDSTPSIRLLLQQALAAGQRGQRPHA